MSGLKSKIKHLENKLVQSRANLHRQQFYLQQWLDQFNTIYLVSELLIGGFAMGFLLGSRQFLHVFKLILSRGLVFLDIYGLAKRYLPFI